MLCLMQSSTELSMHLEIAQQQEATDSDRFSSQTYSFSSFYSGNSLLPRVNFQMVKFHLVAPVI